MFTLAVLIIVSLVILTIATLVASIGGVVFLTVGADLIVAIGIIWLIVWLFKKKGA